VGLPNATEWWCIVGLPNARVAVQRGLAKTQQSGSASWTYQNATGWRCIVDLPNRNRVAVHRGLTKTQQSGNASWNYQDVTEWRVTIGLNVAKASTHKPLTWYSTHSQVCLFSFPSEKSTLMISLCCLCMYLVSSFEPVDKTSHYLVRMLRHWRPPHLRTF
jgi:hypothetical protein